MGMQQKMTTRKLYEQTKSMLMGSRVLRGMRLLHSMMSTGTVIDIISQQVSRRQNKQNTAKHVKQESWEGRSCCTWSQVSLLLMGQQWGDIIGIHYHWKKSTYRDTIWCLILMNVFLSGLSIGWRCVTSTKMLNRLIPTRNVSMMKLLALPIIMCVC